MTLKQGFTKGIVSEASLAYWARAHKLKPELIKRAAKLADIAGTSAVMGIMLIIAGMIVGDASNNSGSTNWTWILCSIGIALFLVLVVLYLFVGSIYWEAQDLVVWQHLQLLKLLGLEKMPHDSDTLWRKVQEVLIGTAAEIIILQEITLQVDEKQSMDSISRAVERHEIKTGQFSANLITAQLFGLDETDEEKKKLGKWTCFELARRQLQSLRHPKPASGTSHADTAA